MYDALTRRRIAAEASCYPSTVDRVIRGLPVRSTSAARIREACERLGIELPEPRVATRVGADLRAERTE